MRMSLPALGFSASGNFNFGSQSHEQGLYPDLSLAFANSHGEASQGWLSLVPRRQKERFQLGLRVPRLGQPRQRWEDFTGEVGRACPRRLSASSLAGQKCDAVPADGSCGSEWCHGKGDACARRAAVCAVGLRECCCLPARCWRAQGPALRVREALSFLPSSCFLPDGN